MIVNSKKNKIYLEFTQILLRFAKLNISLGELMIVNEIRHAIYVLLYIQRRIYK